MPQPKKYRPALRVLASASEVGEQEWRRHRAAMREIAALRQWDMPLAECRALEKIELRAHRTIVVANYEVYHSVIVERYALRQAKRRSKELAAPDPYFGYREACRKQVLEAREALAQGKVSLDTYRRMESEARMYCRLMIAHDKRVKALQDKTPVKPRLYLRRTKPKT